MRLRLTQCFALLERRDAALVGRQLLHRPHRIPGLLHLALMGSIHTCRNTLECLAIGVLRCKRKQGPFPEPFRDRLGKALKLSLHHFIGKRIFETRGQIIPVDGVTYPFEHTLCIGGEGRDLQSDLSSDSEFLCVVTAFGLATLAQIITDAVRQRRYILQRSISIQFVGTAGEQTGFALESAEGFRLCSDPGNCLRRGLAKT